MTGKIPQVLEPACIHWLLSSTTPSLSSQEWRNIFIGSLESKSLDSTCAKACQHASHLLGSAIDDLNLNTMDPATPPSPPVDDLKAWVMLWHLSELNFRFELLALHKCAGTAGHDAVDCDQDICNALQLTSLQAVDMVTVTSGSEWVRTSENESGVSRDLASAYVLCLRTLVVPNLQRDEGGSLGK